MAGCQRIVAVLLPPAHLLLHISILFGAFGQGSGKRKRVLGQAALGEGASNSFPLSGLHAQSAGTAGGVGSPREWPACSTGVYRQKKVLSITSITGMIYPGYTFNSIMYNI